MKILARISQIVLYVLVVLSFGSIILTIALTPTTKDLEDSEGVLSRSHEARSFLGLTKRFGYYQQRDSSGIQLYIITDQIEYAKKQSAVDWVDVKVGEKEVLIPRTKVSSNTIPITLDTFKKVRSIFITSHVVAGIIILTGLLIGIQLITSFMKQEYFKRQNHRRLIMIGIAFLLYAVTQYAAHYMIFGSVFFQEDLVGIKTSLKGDVNMNWTLIAIGVMTILFSAALKKGWEIKQENELTI